MDSKTLLMLKKIREIFTNTGPKILVNNKLDNFHLNISNNIIYKSFGELNKNKIFYIIRRNPTAGFFSNITFVLNNLKICDEMNFIPIIDMENYPTLHNEIKQINGSKNSWEYYFKKLNNYSLNEVYKSKNVFFSSEKFEKNMALNITDKEVSKYIKKIKIKNKIQLKAKNFVNKNFKRNQKILGVHFRGSTYKTARGHAFPPTIKLMKKHINHLINEFNYKKIFVVTEEQKYLNALKKEFKDKVIFYNSFRMTKFDSFKIYPRKNHRYLLGEEILIECLILSKCNGLTYIRSNVISAAIAFAKNKILKHELFLGLNSRNKFLSKYLWFIKSILPMSIGGLKFIKKS